MKVVYSDFKITGISVYKHRGALSSVVSKHFGSDLFDADKDFESADGYKFKCKHAT